MKRTSDIIYNLELSLEEFFFGTKCSVTIKRNQLCKICSEDICSQCLGEGVVLETESKNFSPILCANCLGAGTVAHFNISMCNNSCSQCQGVGIFLESKTWPINIVRGSKIGDKIIIANESHRQRNVIPGDIVIILLNKEHPQFLVDEKNTSNLIVRPCLPMPVPIKIKTIDQVELECQSKELPEYGLWNHDGLSRGKLIFAQFAPKVKDKF